MQANKFTIRDEVGSETVVTATSVDDAVDQAREWVLGGSYGDVAETFWVRARIEGADGEGVSIGVAIEPTVPKCRGGETHDWQSPHEIVGGLKENPGVWGHGGGVIICECCMRCGCQRKTDTWAHDRATGEQGLESVAYAPGHYVLERGESDA